MPLKTICDHFKRKWQPSNPLHTQPTKALHIARTLQAALQARLFYHYIDPAQGNSWYIHYQRFIGIPTQLNYQQASLHDITQPIHILYDYYCQQQEVAFHITMPERDCNIYTDTLVLQQLIASCLHRALSYLTQDETLYLHYQQQEAYLSITIKHQGIALSESERALLTTHKLCYHPMAGFTLNINHIETITDMLHGSMSYHDDTDKGCSILLKIPL